MRQRKIYTKEFKQQAVSLAKDLDSMSEASRQLGISGACLHRWVREDQQRVAESSSPAKVDLSLLQDLERLRKENAELKKVNYILKSAAAFFSQDHLK